MRLEFVNHCPLAFTCLQSPHPSEIYWAFDRESLELTLHLLGLRGVANAELTAFIGGVRGGEV